MNRRRIVLAAAACAVATLLSAVGSSAAGRARQQITIAWAEWKPADYLEQLARDFTRQTRIRVNVVRTPWDRYETEIQDGVWANQESRYDLILGDSQWLGRGATEGHYVDLTAFARRNVPLRDVSEAALHFFCEYDERIWAVPTEGDALAFAYRRDLFESPAERESFRARYGRELAPPTTYAQLREVAEFFTRPEQGLYGIAPFYNGPTDYDSVTMGFDQVLWSFGGELRDPETGAIQGVVNSPTAVEALAFYVGLKQFAPPGAEGFGIGNLGTLNAFASGQAAMAMTWYTFAPDFLDSTISAQAANTSFFVSPAGPGGHFVSLGGQGMSLSAYSKKKPLAKKFLAWFSQKRTQRKWARLGGLPVYNSILRSEEFLEAAPFNAAYAESVPLLRDFYNVPQYLDLLQSTQTHLGAAAAGTETPQQALDAIAVEHSQILPAAAR